MRLEHFDFDATLLISLYSNLPTVFFFYPGPYHGKFPVRVGGPSLLLKWVVFSLVVISPSYPILPRFPYRVLTELLFLRRFWVYPSLSLQMLPPIHTGSTPATLCNTPSKYWACRTRCSINSHIIWFNPDHPLHISHRIQTQK